MERCGISRIPTPSDCLCFLMFSLFLSFFPWKNEPSRAVPPFPRVCIDIHRGGEKTAGDPPSFEYGAPQGEGEEGERNKKTKMEQCPAFNGENIIAFSSPYREYLTKFLHCIRTVHGRYTTARSFLRCEI